MGHGNGRHMEQPDIMKGKESSSRTAKLDYFRESLYNFLVNAG